MNTTELYTQWLEKATADPDLQAELQAIAGQDEEIRDRFYRSLEFGTAGLRGVIGAGTNRMNVYTVGRATQGLADYLNAKYDHPSVAIGYDSRIKSDLFSKEAAAVLAGNGIKVYLYKELEPTPCLSFAVRQLGAQSGIILTASHNPAKYNGYKCYNKNGYQMTDDEAAETYHYIEKVDYFTGIQKANFDAAVADGTVEYIGEKMMTAFLDAVETQCMNRGVCQKADLKVIYTPLNGTGNKPVRAILDRIGVPHVYVVPEQELPDGNFPTCPYPNPEIREALQKGLDLCKTVKPDLLLATDPDCDRVGIAVNQHGEYVLMTGNEVGILLLNFIAQCKTELGTMPKDPVAVTTIVSTDMVNGIAKDYGIEIRRTLTGFKYIGDQIALLESEGHPERYLLGFEESYGYLSGGYVRDKDAVDGSMIICEMASYYKEKGMTLVDAINVLYEKYGYYKNALCNFAFEGEDGMKKMNSIMDHLRHNAPAEIAGFKVVGDSDYQLSVRTEGAEKTEITLPKSNVLEYRLENGSKLIVRPSGTEPKIKIYLSGKGKTAAESDEIIAKMEKAATELLGL